MTFFFLRGDIFKVDRYTYLLAPVVGLASFGLFKGIRVWGAGPTLIIIAGTPIVNFLFTFAIGKKVSNAAIWALTFLLGGILVANWGGRWSTTGFAYSIFGMICNAAVYELFPRATSKSLQQCFWGTLGMGLIGLLLSPSSNWGLVYENHTLQVTLVGFALLSGLFYWLANIWAFDYLPKDHASVLVQGETPAVILFAWVMLNEPLTPAKIVGVTVSLCGAWYLKRSLEQEKPS
jgi:drug/metabolite transporter (DMT)-like permease